MYIRIINHTCTYLGSFYILIPTKFEITNKFNQMDIEIVTKFMRAT